MGNLKRQDGVTKWIWGMHGGQTWQDEEAGCGAP